LPAILMSQARASSTAPARTSDVRSATESRPGSFVWAYRGRIRTISSSLSGHASLDQLQEYLNEVDNDFLADAAMAKLTEIKKKNQSD
jgi:aryl-alcohol dehydrogenase-like predicted oxidoreductase